MAAVNTRYFVGIGSNVNQQRNIRSAVSYLANSFRNIQVSPVYQSPAFGFAGHDFFNLVVEINTVFTPHQLKNWLQNIEDIHGRDRSQPRYSDRTLDIDLLLCGHQIIDDGFIQVPRREILKRDYVLKPLQDLAPDLIHPVKQKRLADLWQAFEKLNGSDLGLVSDDFITNNITNFS